MRDIKSALFKDGFSKKMIVFGLSWLALIIIYTWHLSSSPAGFSPVEAQSIALSINHHVLAHNALSLPHDILLYAANHFHHASLELTRLSSAILALIFIGCFFYVAKIWFGTMVAYVSTAIFALTPLVLLVGRSATSEILLLLPLAVSAAYFWAVRHPERQLVGLLLLTFVAAMTIYVPGGIFIILAGGIYSWPVLKEMFRKLTSTNIAVLGVLSLVLLVPLAYTFYANHLQLRPWVLVPSPLSSVSTELRHIASMAMGIFIHTTDHSNYQIGRLP